MKNNEKSIFQEFCYGKYIMSRMAEDIPLSLLLTMLDEWKALENNEPLFWFFNSRGIAFPTMEQFLENEYQNAEYLCGLLSEDEMQKWIALEHPENKACTFSMSYADAKSLVEKCVENNILQEQKGVKVVAVYKGNMVSKIISMEDCIKSIMQSPEGQETLISALKEEGINFERKFDFLLDKQKGGMHAV